MMFPRPNSEQQRINDLKEYVIISGQEKIVDNHLKKFITYHPKTHDTINWDIRPDYTKKQYNIVTRKEGSSLAHTNATGVRNVNTGYDSVLLYIAPIEKERINTTLTPQQVITILFDYIDTHQTDQYYTQFLLASRALQIAVSPDATTPYIKTDTQYGGGPRIKDGVVVLPPIIYNLYSTNNVHDIAIPNIPIPHPDIIFDADPDYLPKNICTHTIDEIGVPILHDIFGPWQHAMHLTNECRDSDTESTKLYHPIFAIEKWLKSDTFLPPQWPGCPNLRDKPENISHHQWITIQRDIQKMAAQISPHIHPV